MGWEYKESTSYKTTNSKGQSMEIKQEKSLKGDNKSKLTINYNIGGHNGNNNSGNVKHIK